MSVSASDESISPSASSTMRGLLVEDCHLASGQGRWCLMQALQQVICWIEALVGILGVRIA